MKRIIVCLAITSASLFSLSGMNESGYMDKFNDRGAIVKNFLDDRNNKARFINCDGTVLNKNESGEQAILNFIQSLPEALTETDDDVIGYQIDASMLHLGDLLHRPTPRGKKELKDTKWYHEVTDHKTRTATFGITAILAFVAGRYFGSK